MYRFKVFADFFFCLFSVFGIGRLKFQLNGLLLQVGFRLDPVYWLSIPFDPVLCFHSNLITALWSMNAKADVWLSLSCKC